jgi:phosphoadenosine phosphosulfate reductase
MSAEVIRAVRTKVCSFDESISESDADLPEGKRINRNWSMSQVSTEPGTPSIDSLEDFEFDSLGLSSDSHYGCTYDAGEEAQSEIDKLQVSPVTSQKPKEEHPEGCTDKLNISDAAVEHPEGRRSFQAVVGLRPGIALLYALAALVLAGLIHVYGLELIYKPEKVLCVKCIADKAKSLKPPWAKFDQPPVEFPPEDSELDSELDPELDDAMSSDRAQWSKSDVATLTDAQLHDLNTQFQNAPLQELFSWADQTLPSWVLFTSFGPSGMVELKELAKMKLLSRVTICTIDTLHFFNETYELIAQVEEQFGFKTKRFCPVDLEGRELSSAEEFAKVYGAELWKHDPDKYAELTKAAPMRRALEELDVSAHVTGRRAVQGDERTGMTIIELLHNHLRINPLAYWSLDDIWAYIRREEVPYNPLHDQGYLSVGDWPTTSQTPEGGNERSGRWLGSKRTECGMHSAHDVISGRAI